MGVEEDFPPVLRKNRPERSEENSPKEGDEGKRCAWVFTKGPWKGSICGRRLFDLSISSATGKSKQSTGCQYHRKCDKEPVSPSTPTLYGIGCSSFRKSLTDTTSPFPPGKKEGTQTTETGKKEENQTTETGKKEENQTAETGKKEETQTAETGKKEETQTAETGKKEETQTAVPGKKELLGLVCRTSSAQRASNEFELPLSHRAVGGLLTPGVANRTFRLLEEAYSWAQEKSRVSSSLFEIFHRRAEFFPPAELDAEESNMFDSLAIGSSFTCLVLRNRGKRELLNQFSGSANSLCERSLFLYEGVSRRDTLFVAAAPAQHCSSTLETPANSKPPAISGSAPPAKRKSGKKAKSQKKEKSAKSEAESSFGENLDEVGESSDGPLFGSIFPGEPLEETVDAFLASAVHSTPRSALFFLLHSLEWWGMWIVLTRRVLACCGEALTLDEYRAWMRECVREFFSERFIGNPSNTFQMLCERPLNWCDEDREVAQEDCDEIDSVQNVCRTVFVFLWPHLKPRLSFPPFSSECSQRTFLSWIEKFLRPAVFSHANEGKEEELYETDRKESESRRTSNPFEGKSTFRKCSVVENLLRSSESLSRFLLLCGSGNIFRTACWLHEKAAASSAVAEGRSSFPSTPMGFAVVALVTGFLQERRKEEAIKSFWEAVIEEKSSIAKPDSFFGHFLDPFFGGKDCSWEEVAHALCWIRSGEMTRFLGEHPKFSNAALVSILARSHCLLQSRKEKTSDAQKTKMLSSLVKFVDGRIKKMDH